MILHVRGRGDVKGERKFDLNVGRALFGRQALRYKCRRCEFLRGFPLENV